MGDIYSINVTTIDNEIITLERFKNKLLLIVNVASKCGLTKQYESLETLYKKYKEQGLEILAFPSNEFGEQEPGSEEEIKQFCEMNFGVSFSMFAKICVNDSNRHPLYQQLLKEKPERIAENTDFEVKMKNYGVVAENGKILWNFEKFLIDRQGNVVKHFSPEVSPTSDFLESFVREYI